MATKKIEPMYVIKRNGEKELVRFDKITNRIQKLLNEMKNSDIDAVLITQKICSRIYSGISTTELDILSSQICMSMVIDNINFSSLGAKIVISNHQKNTKENFLEVVTELINNKDINGDLAPLVSEELLNISTKYGTKINELIKHDRDYLLDYFGFKTLEKSYLLKIGKKLIERPQHLFMRVAIGIHGEDFENVKKTYDNISLKNYTHATPTLFNASTNYPQLSSCYLTATADSLEGIFDSITECAKISKWSGGIGLHVSNIRASGSYIRKTGGYSRGLIPMLKVYNDVARFIDQGGGKRNGSIAIYLEPSHPDIFEFLDAKKNHGSDEIRARDLFYALWISDLFMKQVENNDDWWLMCPDYCPGLPDVYGEEYEKLYMKYVDEKKYSKKIKARELWDAIISSQTETGVPYISYKDHVNRKNNQKNIDTIRSSNLCVDGDTMILTSKGYFSIKSLKDKKIEVWNGKQWSETLVEKTGENQKLININFSDGMSLKCTEYHKFHVVYGLYPEKHIVEAKDLKKGMLIIPHELPSRLIEDNEIEDYSKAYFEGKSSYKEKIDKIVYDKIIYKESSFSKPPINQSLKYKLKWLEGLYDKYGYIHDDYLTYLLKVPIKDRQFLVDIYYLLQTIGVRSTIDETNNCVNCDTTRLHIFAGEMHKLIDKGFKPLNFSFKTIINNKNEQGRPTVESIIDNNEYGDTYCFNEPLEHKGIFNGILTGNCNEINQVSNKEETAVCLTADTIIMTEKGPKKIVDCDNLNILSFYNNDEDLIKNQRYIKGKLINNGIKEVFEIDLVKGFPIKATKNHKFLVLKKINTYEWKTVEELTLSDRINRPNIEPLPDFKNIDIDKDFDEESLVVGWIIGAGWQRFYKNINGAYTYAVCFGNDEKYAQKYIIDYFNKINEKCVSNNGHTNTNIKTYIDKYGVVQWSCSEESFAKYFIDKNISDKINSLEPSKIGSILSGLFSVNGTVYIENKKFYVGLSSLSKQLLIDVQILLKCFGIVSGVFYNSRNIWQGKLTIQNIESIKLFSKYINFLICPEKKKKLEKGIMNYNSLNIKNVDQREWMSIRSIKSVGFENVYDLNIPSSHNFIANMVTVHNCNLSSICLSSILEYPSSDLSKRLKWYNLMSDEEQKLSSYYFVGNLKILTIENCVYCKLLKCLLNSIGRKYDEISEKEAEIYRNNITNKNSSNDKPFDVYPQLFSMLDNQIVHLGGYTNCWNVLSPKINYKKLHDLSYELVINLNKIIDKNFYPVEKTKVSNMRHRPMGIGVQGLADLFLILKIPFDSFDARKINKDIFETIYYGAMSSSYDLALKEGHYSSFKGSPLSEGKFQFDLWEIDNKELSGRWDWEILRKKIMKTGVRNSLLIALMPTASTSQIMSNYECIEPVTSNLYTRRTLAGEFIVLNKYLIKDLTDLDIWNEDTKNRLQYDKGSVKNIKGLPSFMKEIYKTVWEIPQRSIIEMSAERGPFVCQSQSLNLFFEKPEYKKLTMAHMLGWKLGLKTGSYYIRSKPSTSAQNFTIDPNVEKKLKVEDENRVEETECLSCGS